MKGGARSLIRSIGGGAALIGIAAFIATGASATARVAAAHRCSSYPRPGTIASGGVPADLKAEYSVLARRQRRSDRLARHWLRDLPESAILPAGARFLARSADGRVYLVPARHLLAFPLIPPRCLPRSERADERSLARELRVQYAHQALCLVVISGGQESPSCATAPGTVDPLLYTAGTPGFGIAPDGVSAVEVHYFDSPPRRVRVHENFWIINDPLLIDAPCGLDWLNGRGRLLRTVQSCVSDQD